MNREQASCYQQLVLDFLILSLLCGKAHGEWFSPDYESRVAAMLDYIASIMDAGGHVPQFGDSDDAQVTRLSPDRTCPYRSLLATGGHHEQRSQNTNTLLEPRVRREAVLRPFSSPWYDSPKGASHD